MVKCRVCGIDTREHYRCDACDILCGAGHLESYLTSYRKHSLCGHCIHKWKVLDAVIGREASWEEFLSPPPKIFMEKEKEEDAVSEM